MRHRNRSFLRRALMRGRRGGLRVTWREGFENGVIPEDATTPATVADLSAPGMDSPIFAITADSSGAFSISGATLVLASALTDAATLTITATSGAQVRQVTVNVSTTRWLLASGAWDDTGEWDDSANWKDAA